MANAPTTTNQQQTQLAPKDVQISQSERFTNMVMKQYSSTGVYNPTEREKQLIRNYFICIDQMLAKTEAERQRKNAANRNHDYDNTLPYSWNTIDLPQLAQDLAHYARVGLDMMEDNTLFPIPYKNNKGNMYSITLMEGYNGIRYQAEKYALDPFKAVTVEVIYQNDTFRTTAMCRMRTSTTTTVGKPTKRTTSTQSASSRPTAASLADISPTSTAGTRTRWKVWMPVDVSKSSTILRRHSTTSTKAKPRHPTSAQSSNTRRTAAGRR